MSFEPTRSPIQFTMPSGKLAFWCMKVQAAFTQAFVLKDSGGTTIASNQGNGSGTFQTTNGPFTITITANGNPSSVLFSSTALLNAGAVKEETFVFASEDAGDGDYNDCFLTITWFQSAG